MPSYGVQPDIASAAFLDHAKRGEFLIVKDTETGEFHEPRFDVTIDPERYVHHVAQGTGKIVSWSIVHERDADGNPVRRPVGIVELDEGPWWWTEITGVDPDADLMGARVVADFQVFDDGSAVPYFRAA